MRKDQVKFYVTMETPVDDEITVVQKVCVFDNCAKDYLCKKPKEIDVSMVWSRLKNQSFIEGLILEQFQKEVHKKSIEIANKKIKADLKGTKL